MKKLREILMRAYRLLFSRGSIAFLLSLLCIDLYFEFAGLPRFITSRIEARLSSEGNRCDISYAHLGVFHGLILRGVQYSVNNDGTLITADLPKVQIHPRYSYLLKLQFVPKYLRLDNASVCFSLPEINKNVLINKIGISTSLEHENVVNAKCVAECNGVQLAFNGQFHSLEYSKAIAKLSKLIDDSTDDVLPKDVFEKILNNLLSSDFGYRDSFIQINANVDLDSVKNSSLNGAFSVSDAIVADVTISKLHGRFDLVNGTLYLRNLLWMLGRSEMVGGSLQYDIVNNKVQCNFNASIIPSTLFQLFGIDSSSLRRYVHVIKPMHINITVPRVTPTVDALKLYAYCSFEDAFVSGMEVPSGNFMLAYENKIASFSDVSVDFKNDGSERITGSAIYDVANKLISCQMDGSACLGTKLQAMHMNLPPMAKKLFSENMNFSLQLHPSPVKLSELDASVLLKLPELNWKDVCIKNVVVPVQLKNGKLSIEKGTFQVDDIALSEAHFSASFDFLDTKDGIYKIPHDIKINALNDKECVDGLSWKGTIQYNSSNQYLQCKGNGNVFINRLYDTYLKGRNLYEDFIYRNFLCEKLPYTFEIELNVPSFGDWALQGNIQAQEGCGFGCVVLKDGHADFSINKNRTAINNIQATLSNGDKVSLNIKLDYYPYIFEVTDLHLEGDPAPAIAFMESFAAQKIYEHIWKDVTWSKIDSERPIVDIPFIKYYSDDASINWGLDMDASIKARNFKYGDELVTSGDVTMKMRLPDELILEKIKLSFDKADLDAKSDFSFGAIPHCNFTVNNMSGQMHLRDILLYISPSLESVLPTFSIAEDSVISCSGSFDMTQKPDVDIKGKFKTSDFTVRDISVKNLEGDWSYINDVLRLNILKSESMDGTFRGTATYDFPLQKGDFIGECNKLSLNKIINLINHEDPTNDLPGAFSASCSLHYQIGWGGTPCQIDGTGHFSVVEADIWNVPMLKQLSSMVDSSMKLLGLEVQSGIGKITEADANVIFMGRRMLINDFKTNGTLVTLVGAGEYRPNEDYVDFSMQTQVLKSVGVVSMLFKPLTGAFQARLKGPRKTAQWEVQNNFSNMFK